MERRTEIIFAAGKYGAAASEPELPEALAMLQVLLLLDRHQRIQKSHCVKAAAVICSGKQYRRLEAAAERGKKFVRIFPAGGERYAVIFSGDAIFLLYAAGIREIRDMSFRQAVCYVKKWSGQIKKRGNRTAPERGSDKKSSKK